LKEPSQESKLCNPNFLLVSLIAFNEECHRLGYGGGFYDRTIEAMKRAGNIVCTIGMGFEILKYENHRELT
jgi:5-formyltetrahydrofolate cyclo-ligase